MTRNISVVESDFLAVSFENPATAVDFFPQTTAKSTNIIYLHATVSCLVVMIVSIGVPCKEIGPSLSLVLIKMAKIWENLAALYGAKCRVPTNFIRQVSRLVLVLSRYNRLDF